MSCTAKNRRFQNFGTGALPFKETQLVSLVPHTGVIRLPPASLMAFVTPTLPFTTRKNLRHTSLLTKRSAPSTLQMTLDVVVTGAAGRTGRLVLQKLLESPSFSGTGLVRSIPRAKEAIGNEDVLVEGDITKPETLDAAFTGKDALVILTSAIPKMQGPPQEGAPPTFTFDADGMPEIVDWHGAKAQIDLAKEKGLKHVVFVGSMGGTDDNNPLNRIGNGNILRFKRKAENYLMEAGIDYTIINPAGLVNELEGERELVVGRNDELFSIFDRGDCLIPRGDVARVVLAALGAPNARNKAMDLAARKKGDGTVTDDPSHLFDLVGPNI